MIVTPPASPLSLPVGRRPNKSFLIFVQQVSCQQGVCFRKSSIRHFEILDGISHRVRTRMLWRFTEGAHARNQSRAGVCGLGMYVSTKQISFAVMTARNQLINNLDEIISQRHLI